MVFNSNQFSLDMGWNFSFKKETVIYKDVIVDRKSHYSVVAYAVGSYEDVKKCFSQLKKDSYFRKATHNSYAYRIQQENGSILEGKNDDGEQGAGMCILRELQRENTHGIMLIVTRYFWGIQLHADRFKNVIEACKIFFKKEKEIK